MIAAAHIPGRLRLRLRLRLVLLGALLPSSALAAKPQVVFPQGSEQPLSALQDIDVIERLGDRIPAGLSFRDAEGHTLALDDLLHQRKPLLVTLGYYRCPMLCGLVLDGLVKSLKTAGLTLGKDFLAVSISIDPSEEAKLAAEQQKRILGALGPAARAEHWPFLLGDPSGSRQLAEAVGFRYKYDETSKQFAHSAVAFVLTPEGIVSRYLYGVDFQARDTKLALLEAGGGRVGTSFDKVLLSCFRYDPVNRRYAPYVFGFMRLGAGTVFIALATLLTILWRKEIAMKRQRQTIRTASPGTGAGPGPGPATGRAA
jgi:protein SCO1/2